VILQDEVTQKSTVERIMTFQEN